MSFNFQLKNFDLFGYQTNLNFFKDHTFKTNFGGLLSVILLLFLVLKFITLIISLIKRENFKSRNRNDFCK